jgi:hypothetical protein
MLYGETKVVYCENYKKTHEYAVWAECRVYILKEVIYIKTTGL